MMDIAPNLIASAAAALADGLRKMGNIEGELRAAEQLGSRLQSMLTVYRLRSAINPSGAHAYLLEGLDALMNSVTVRCAELQALALLVSAGVDGDPVWRA